MGYSVPVVIRKGDEVETIGFADIETLFEPFKVTLFPEWRTRIFGDQRLSLSVSKGELDIEELSVIINDNKENSTC